MTKTDEELARGLRLIADHFAVANENQRTCGVRGWPNMRTATSEVLSQCAALAADRLEARVVGEKAAVAAILAMPEYLAEVRDEQQTWLAERIAAALSPALEARGGEGMADWSISLDGPHKINDHRRIMAKWLMDSKFDDAEAYGCVAYHPCITDRNKALAKEPASLSRGEPEGWKLVPVEPTPEMLQPGCSKHTPGQPMSTDPERQRYGGGDECPVFVRRRKTWASMLSAAPAPPSPEDKDL